ncbi:hypothetical protein O4J55_30020, partial [Paracoccus sp. PXZ]
VYWLETLAETVVTFLRGEVTEQPKVATSTNAAGAAEVSVMTEKTVTETALSARVTTLELAELSPARPRRTWSEFPLDAHVLTGWSEVLEPLPTIPNLAPLQP